MRDIDTQSALRNVQRKSELAGKAPSERAGNAAAEQDVDAPFKHTAALMQFLQQRIERIKLRSKPVLD